MNETRPTIVPRLFSKREGSGYRTRRSVFFVVYLLLFVGLTTPPVRFSRTRFGLNGLGWLSIPKGFWWVMVAMSVSFLGLLFLYLTEESEG